MPRLVFKTVLNETIDTVQIFFPTFCVANVMFCHVEGYTYPKGHRRYRIKEYDCMSLYYEWDTVRPVSDIPSFDSVAPGPRPGLHATE